MMNDSVLCRSYSKNSETCTTVQAYTNAWIRLINHLERSKAILSSAR